MLGINYWETYAPMFTWAMVLNCQLKQVDFVVAYTQTPIECDVYTRLLTDIEFMGKTAETYVLKLLKYIYRASHLGIPSSCDHLIWNAMARVQTHGVHFC